MGISFLDSAFLPLPQAIDLWVITLCWNNPDAMLWFAAMATLGSVAGCVVLYGIARRGGHAYLERKIGKVKAGKIRNWYERYEFLTVMVPAILPPPTPLKAFVITAGVVEVHLGKFVVALLIGRSVRYFGEAFLAVHYGQAVWHLFRRHGLTIALATAGVFLLGVLLMRALARRRQAAEPA